MTGAPMPDGADAIVMVERTRVDGDDVRASRSRQRRRPRAAPRAATSRRASSCSTPGRAHARAPRCAREPRRRTRSSCHPRPRVGVLLDRRRAGRARPARAGPDPRLQPADAARAARRGRLRAGRPRHRRATTKRAITDGDRRARPTTCDALAHERRGVGRRLRLREGRARRRRDRRAAALSLWMQVAIKPAKPLAFAHARRACPCSGCPGNPVSSRVSFELFARPALRKLAGRADVAAEPVRADGGRRRCAAGPTASCTSTGCGSCGRRRRATCASAPGVQASNVLSGMAAPTAWRSCPTATASTPGAEVRVLLL